MSAPAPPLVFSPARRVAARRRAAVLQRRLGAARYLHEDMAEDVLERLAFLRHAPARALVVGEPTGTLAAALTKQGCAVTCVDPATGWDEERPLPHTGFDLIASLGTLDTVNDPVGALIHIHRALASGGLAIASFMGAGSLPALRAAVLAADGDRPAPRLHPMIDVRAGAQLLQRAGWADPVVDSRHLDVRFSSFASLVADLRAQGLGNVLSRSGPPLSRERSMIVSQMFGERTTDRFEILTLSGWRR